ncbi:MAG: PQQ-binding-like beta-propeller repeat protein, partial [Candidatus Bathyarchaeia archaeon]
MNKNKTPIAIALILMAAVAVSFISLPATNAQTYPEKKTYAYIIAQPNPVGVGQPVKLLFGITDYLNQYPDGWTGITITVETPDGKTETLGPYKTDATGTTGATYVPNRVGTYYFQVHFPRQLYNWTVRTSRAPTLFGPIWYAASDSEKYALTVQEEPLPGFPGVPLPTEYWSRPIDDQLREWTSIAGNWVMEPPQRYAPYNQGPEAPHILWAQPLVKGAMSALGGGLVGGYTADTSEIDQRGFETGDAYEGLFTPRSSPVIIGGVLYFNRYKADGSTRVEQEVVAVDLHTGDELWVRNWGNRTLAFGQLFYWDSFNYHGTYAYLWSTVGSTWNCYEASTGRWVYSISNVPSGTQVFGPHGEIIIYTLDLQRGWMTKWNSTHVERQTKINQYGPTGSTHGSWITAYMGTTLNGTLGIMWNKTIPTGLPGSVWAVFLDDIIIGNEIYGTGFHYMIGDNPIVFWAISLKYGQEGTLLYNVTWQKPMGDVVMWRVAYSAEDRVFVMQAKEPRQLYGFDLDNGRQLWGPTETMDYRSVYSYSGYIVKGQLYYVSQFAGTVYCYEVKTGKLLWTYYASDPYGASEAWQKEFGANEWPIEICFITDGKVYITHSEHSPNQPLPRGAPLICLDAETGDEIFRVNGLLRQTRWGGRHLIGDSIMVGMDTYDQRVYAIGKGPSATTVTASPKTTVHGSKVLVEGTVTDISPGTQDSAIKLRFPNGVPAVADESMSDWMLYVYKQFPCPANVKGVEVIVEVLDPNGNYYEVARTTSDGSGFFKATFEPPVPGAYTVIARFAGSKSYWPSHAETAMVVEDAPPASP